jgi:hypothetical protein
MATRYKIATQDRAETLSNKTINEAKGSDIASATTTDIGAATGNYVNVTGTTTITGLGTVQAGTRRIVNFTGALTLTHNATSLILPTAANITTAAGDTAVFVSLGSGNWKCVSYDRASGAALAAGGGASNFLRATLSTNQLDIGARETVKFNSEVFDSGGNFNTTTYQYTTPSDGYYLVSYVIRFSSVAGTSASVSVWVGGSQYGDEQFATAEFPTGDNKGTVSGTHIIYANASTTIDVRAETGDANADIQAAQSFLNIAKLA